MKIEAYYDNKKHTMTKRTILYRTTMFLTSIKAYDTIQVDLSASTKAYETIRLVFEASLETSKTFLKASILNKTINVKKGSVNERILKTVNFNLASI